VVDNNRNIHQLDPPQFREQWCATSRLSVRERVLDQAQTAHRSVHSQNVTKAPYQTTSEDNLPN
jgi:hypothetical protein